MLLFSRFIALIESIPECRVVDRLCRLVLVLLGTWLLAVLVSFAVIGIYPGPDMIDAVFGTRSGVISALFLAPLLETLGMRGLFWALRRLKRGNAGLLGWSTLFWWVAHLPSENWGVPAAGTFWVMGVLYLAFERRSTDAAMIHVSLFHLAFNALSFGLYTLMLR
jgi:hypothetical protein